MHTPDSWVIIKIDNPEYDKPYYKVLGGWSGGYLDGDSWRMNSGITKIDREGDFYLFNGLSGSVYKCHKNAETMRMSQAGIWNSLKEKYNESVEIIKVTDINNEELGL